MLERSPEIDRALTELTPAMPDERGDWQQVVADARSRGRAREWWARPWTARPGLNPAFAATIAVALLVVVPALAVARDWWFSSDSPQPIADVVTVRTVQADDGSAWVLTAYVSQDAGLCFALSPAAGTSTGAAMTCGGGVRGEPNLPADVRRHAVGFALTRGEGTPSFVFGTAASNVSRVELALSRGSLLTGEAFRAPRELGVGDLRFYVVEIPPDTRVLAIRARDTRGSLLEERPVPQRPQPATASTTSVPSTAERAGMGPA